MVDARRNPYEFSSSRKHLLMSPPPTPRAPLGGQAEEQFAARQHIGARQRQEDYYAFARVPGPTGGDASLLTLVADGMGGHEAGAFASRLASNAFVDSFLRGGGHAPGERLAAALAAANEAILNGTRAALQQAGCMGTTLVAALLGPDGLYWVSVGDSPAYLFRDGQIRRLNADHSYRPLIEEQIERGLITREQARQHPNRNTLRSAVTGYPIDLIDLSPNPLALRDDDLVVCASDGLFSLSVAGINSALQNLRDCAASEIANGLVEAVLGMRVEYQDNVTVAVVRVGPRAGGEGRGEKREPGRD